MPLSLYEITVPGLIRDLKVLSTIFEKGIAHVGAGNESKILESRLIADMEGFIYQIQRVSDTVKGLVVRLGGAQPVAWADNEKTIPEVQDRINKTIALLESVDPKSFEGKEEATITMPPNNAEYSGKNYVLERAIPNFYFHFVMAYALLRKEGVPIGKKDFLNLVPK